MMYLDMQYDHLKNRINYYSIRIAPEMFSYSTPVQRHQNATEFARQAHTGTTIYQLTANWVEKI